MDKALHSAFRAADYRFETPAGQLLLKVDVPDPALGHLLRGLGADCMGVLTAFNPQGRRQDDAANRAAQEQLRLAIIEGGWNFLPGRNEDPAGAWPAEDSFLVAGIGVEAAHALAARYGQLAFLWASAAQATLRLIETAAPT